MNVPPEMMTDAEEYMKIVGGFIFTQAVFDAFGQIFRSNGKTTAGMFMALAMNIINIAGNYCFLYGPLKFLGFGAKGVAISTSASRIVVVIIAIIYFAVAIEGKISIKCLKPFPFDILKKLLRLGIPSAGENISYNFFNIPALFEQLCNRTHSFKVFFKLINKFLASIWHKLNNKTACLSNCIIMIH